MWYLYLLCYCLILHKSMFLIGYSLYITYCFMFHWIMRCIIGICLHFLVCHDQLHHPKTHYNLISNNITHSFLFPRSGFPKYLTLVTETRLQYYNFLAHDSASHWIRAPHYPLTQNLILVPYIHPQDFHIPRYLN